MTLMRRGVRRASTAPVPPPSRPGRWCALVFALSLQLILPSHAFPAPAGDPGEGVAERERELQDLERQTAAVAAALAADQAERQALLTELQAREREVAVLAIAGRELAHRQAEQGRVAEGLRTRAAEARAALAVQLADLGGQLRSAYAMGRAEGLRVLLNQQDPRRASRIMSYFAYLNRERLRGIKAVEAGAERLATLARETEREGTRLAALSAEQAANQARLEAARAERARVLEGLEQRIQGREQTLTGLGHDAENLRLLVEHLRARAQIEAELAVRIEPFAEHQGRLAWPLLEARPLIAFGAPKAEDSDLTWDGVLLAAREGEEVRAVWAGRVVYADWLLGFGMLMVIDHGDGYLSFYGHNQALLREVGDWVAADEVIALGGNSGGRGQPMLYFAIRHNGEPLDPARWCG
jgi:murein hydrolase activator